MRNTSGPTRGTWATYVKAARERAIMSKAELARRLAVDRGTIHRWETGQSRPENAEIVDVLSRVLSVDLEEALAAAGLRPGIAPPAAPAAVVDEELELVATDSRLSARTKKRIIDLILERRERDRLASIEETRRVIDLFRDDRSA